MVKLLNAFSLNMLAASLVESLNGINIIVKEISVENAIEALKNGFESAVGHADTASILSDVLGIEVPFNRSNVELVSGDLVIVGQYIGPRLPEGTQILPEGSTIKWIELSVA